MIIIIVIVIIVTAGTRQNEYLEALPSSANDEVRCDCTMETLHDTRFVERRWWNDGCTLKTVVTWRSSASMIPAPDAYSVAEKSQQQKGQTVFRRRPPRWPSGKVSASREEDPGFESRLLRDIFGVESYQWLKNWHSRGYPARRLAI